MQYERMLETLWEEAEEIESDHKMFKPCTTVLLLAEGRTLEEVSRIFKCSRERVRQHKNKAAGKLKRIYEFI